MNSFIDIDTSSGCNMTLFMPIYQMLNHLTLNKSNNTCISGSSITNIDAVYTMTHALMSFGQMAEQISDFSIKYGTRWYLC